MRLIVLNTLILGALATHAEASGGADVQGATCSPAGSTYSNYTITNTGVTFFGTYVGTQDFYCDIPNAQEMSSPATFSIQYTDNTGTAGNEVVATYYKMNKTSGALTAIASITTHAGCASGTLKTCSVNFIDTLAPSTYRYFIAVTLERASSTPTEIFWGATVR